MRGILTCIILSGMLVSVQAATYTVDPGGSGDYTTISAALAVAVDDDTVIVNDGTYQESITLSAGVRLLAADGATPTIQYDGTGTAAGAVIQCTDTDDTTIVDGFTITGDSGSDTVSIIVYSRQYGSATGVKIFRNCSVSRFTSYAFSTEQNQSHVIEDCEIYDGVTGIYSRLSGTNNRVSRCRFHDLGSGGWNHCALFTYSASNYVVDGNVIYNCDRYGLMFRASSAIEVTNNIVFDNGRYGIFEYDNNPGIIITNNTVYNNSSRGLSLYADSAKVIQNNIMWGNTTDLYADANTFLPGNVAYNCFSSVSNVDTADLHNVYSDPLFVNTTAGSYDFTLQGTSPCLNAGSDGNDMGAYGGTSPNGYTAPLPVELSTFSATAGAAAVVLAWTTATETDNLGFNVLRSVNGGVFTQINAVLIPGAGTTTLPQSYSYTDEAPVAGASYQLEMVSTDGGKSYSAVVTADDVSGITDIALTTAGFVLTNPSDGAVSFSLPGAVRATVSVMDVDGTVLATQSGAFNEGVNAITTDLAAGTYFVRIVTEGRDMVKRMIIIK